MDDTGPASPTAAPWRAIGPAGPTAAPWRAIGPAGPTAAPWRAIGLAGPTASGKTALALAAAARWPLEIISVDSAQVFRGLDIGTAKPSVAQRAGVPHHLIDILDPTQAYSAAQFVADAGRLIGEINQRGRLALLVGGTMLYFKALIDGLDAMPAAHPAVRAALDARAAALGWPALHAELARVDPASAARLPPGDGQRIQRALEVWQVSGRPLRSFHGQPHQPGQPLPLLALEPSLPAPPDRHGAPPDGRGAPNPVDGGAGLADPAGPAAPFDRAGPSATDGPAGCAIPVGRAWLHQRIAQRFDAMLADGLVAEVRALRDRADLHPRLPAMRCVGYRQAWAALDADNLAPLREQGIAATRQLAKRQLTWLRGMHRISVACDSPGARSDGLAALAGLIDAPGGSSGNRAIG